MSSTGSFVPPNEDAAKRPLRDLFWSVIEKHAPQVIALLRSDVLPVFQREGAPLLWKSCPEAAATALQKWVNSVGLSDPWFVRDAFNLVNAWTAAESSKSVYLGNRLDPSNNALHTLGEATASRLAGLSLADDLALRLKRLSSEYLQGNPDIQLGHALTEDLSFHAEGWIPIQEKREAFRERVVKEFERALTTHMDALQSIYAAAGMLAADRPSRTERNLGWLVEHVFLRLTIQQIADSQPNDDTRVSPQAVGDAIRKARDELGSSFKSDRGRRPLKRD